MTLLNVDGMVFGLLGMWAVGLLILSMFSAIRAFSLKRSTADEIAAGLCLMLAYLLNQCLAAAAINRNGAEFYGGDLLAEKLISAVPVLAVPVFMAGLTLLETSIVSRTDRYLKKWITVNSIKEATDKMPSGILEYVQGGKVVLVNPAMEKIVDMLFGEEAEPDGAQLWDMVEQESRKIFGEDSGTPILPSEDESKAFLFRKAEHAVEGMPVTEILAYDVTEAYAVSRKLMEENGRLSGQRDHLMHLGDLVDSVTREREMLEAKVRIHDELGSLLIATKRYLTGGQSDRDDIKAMWKTNLSLLQGREREQAVDEFAPVMKAAEDVGVNIVVKGEYPKEKEIRELLVFALGEEITNTVRHGDGDGIVFEIEDEGKQYRCVISNNGKAPDEPITERGGLKHLRELVENYGGSMELESSPVVILRLTFPKF